MIKRFKNITFIGTSHISEESIQEVTKIIEKESPSIIALELDRARFQAIISKKQRKIKIQDIKAIGIKGFLFNMVGSWIENKLGKAVNTTPGSEMKKAIFLAKKHKISLALIDQNIQLTLKKISSTLTWKEKFKLTKDLIKASFMKGSKEIDLKKVPSETKIMEITDQVKKEYPTLYKALITDRDKHMSKALYKIATTNSNKKITAILGAGHIKGIIINLKRKKWSKRKTGKKSKQSFSQQSF
jgi:pheromone shutdown-related protein TraB